MYLNRFITCRCTIIAIDGAELISLCIIQKALAEQKFMLDKAGPPRYCNAIYLLIKPYNGREAAGALGPMD